MTNLELISQYPKANDHSTSLLFVHGAFCGAWVWEEHFLPYFAAHGYAAHALSLRGHGRSEGRERLSWASLEDYVQDLNQAVNQLGTQPVLVGHSMGGVVVQKYLQNKTTTAAVLMASGPPQGMLTASLMMALRNPLLYVQICLLQTFGKRVSSAHVLRKAVFSDLLSDAKAHSFFARMQDESFRVAMELVWPQSAHLADPPPQLLVLGAEQDFFIPPVLVRATAEAYRTKAMVFPGMSHAMMLDVGWRHVADYILDWLAKCRSAAQPLPCI